MDPLLTGVIGLIGFAILMVAIAWRRWTNTTASFSRVEALRALVAESSRLAGPPVAVPPVTDPDVDRELRLPKQSRKELRLPSQAVAIGSPAHQFVVTVPDTPHEGASQLSFQRTEGST